MADGDRSKGWALVLDEGGGLTRVLRVRAGNGDDGDAVLAIIRAALRDAFKAGGCRSISIGVHVEGAACDHEVGS